MLYLVEAKNYPSMIVTCKTAERAIACYKSMIFVPDGTPAEVMEIVDPGGDGESILRIIA
jgi:hypothetical protein